MNTESSLARSLDTVNTGVSRFLRARVFAWGLSDRFCRGRDVEQVISDLKQESKPVRIAGDICQFLPISASNDRPTTSGCTDQRAGLEAVNPLQLLGGNLPRLSLKVLGLSSYHSARSA